MNKFLEIHNVPKLTQKEIEYLNRSLNGREVESIIKKTFQENSPGSDGFTGKFYQMLKDELKPILKLFQKGEEAGRLLNSMMPAFP